MPPGPRRPETPPGSGRISIRRPTLEYHTCDSLVKTRCWTGVSRAADFAARVPTPRAGRGQPPRGPARPAATQPSARDPNKLAERRSRPSSPSSTESSKRIDLRRKGENRKSTRTTDALPGHAFPLVRWVISLYIDHRWKRHEVSFAPVGSPCKNSPDVTARRWVDRASCGRPCSCHLAHEDEATDESAHSRCLTGHRRGLNGSRPDLLLGILGRHMHQQGRPCLHAQLEPGRPYCRRGNRCRCSPLGRHLVTRARPPLGNHTHGRGGSCHPRRCD